MYEPTGEFFPSYGTTVYGTASYGTPAYGTAVQEGAEEWPATVPYEQHVRHDPGAATAGTGISYPAPEMPGPCRHEAAFVPHPRVGGDEPAPSGPDRLR
ncbi:hypothetical protein ACFV0G_11085, partial [Kitasatospora sp. NPDC059571]